MPNWHVTIDVTYPGSQPSPTDDQWDALQASLSPDSSAMLNRDRDQIRLQLTVSANNPVDATTTGHARAVDGLAKLGVGDPHIVAAEVVTEAEWTYRMRWPLALPLAGTADAAQVLGVESRQRVQQLRKSDPEFPPPVGTVAGGPVWTWTSLELYAHDRNTRPGPRPRD